MAKVPLAIVDAVGIQDTLGRAGEIMVESFERFLRVDASGSKQKAQEFLVFGVDAENRVRRIYVRGSMIGDKVELPIALGVVTHGQGFLGFASPQAMSVEKFGHNCDTDFEASLGEFFGDLWTGEVGPAYAFAHGITCDIGVNELQKGRVEVGQQAQA